MTNVSRERESSNACTREPVARAVSIKKEASCPRDLFIFWRKETRKSSLKGVESEHRGLSFKNRAAAAQRYDEREAECAQQDAQRAQDDAQRADADALRARAGGDCEAEAAALRVASTIARGERDSALEAAHSASCAQDAQRAKLADAERATAAADAARSDLAAALAAARSFCVFLKIMCEIRIFVRAFFLLREFKGFSNLLYELSRVSIFRNFATRSPSSVSKTRVEKMTTVCAFVCVRRRARRRRARAKTVTSGSASARPTFFLIGRF